MFNRYVIGVASATLFLWSGAVIAHGQQLHHHKQCHQGRQAEQGRQCQQAQQDQDIGQQYEEGQQQQTDITELRILSLLHHANLMEIQMAGLVADRAADQRVKDFALILITDHQGADAKVLDLAKLEGLDVSTFKAETPEEQAAMDLEMKTMANLQALRGADFDRAFLNAMIDGHQSLLDRLTIARDTLAETQTGTLLEELIPTVQSHLDQAEDLLGQI